MVVLVDQQWLVVFYACTHYISQYIVMMNIVYNIQPFAMSNEQLIFNDKYNNKMVLINLKLGHALGAFVN